MKKLLFIVLAGSMLFAGQRFVRDNSKQVVKDTKTHLMWQDNKDAKTVKRDWQGAINYCRNLKLGGYRDWRLPSEGELLTIVDYREYKPTISPVFKNVASKPYWSSTSYAGNPSCYWIVSFYNGIVIWDGIEMNDYVRCIRDY